MQCYRLVGKDGSSALIGVHRIQNFRIRLDRETLDPAGSGSYRIQPDWVPGSPLQNCTANPLDWWNTISVPGHTSKRVLGYTCQLSVLGETVFWVQKHLWREASEGTANSRRKTFVFFSSQFEAFGLTLTPCKHLYFDGLKLRLTICFWHLLNWAEVP